MIKAFKYLCPAFLVCLVFSCSSESPIPAGSVAALKDRFEDDFLIGVAVNTDQIYEKDARAAAIISGEFNSLTAENIMKCGIIHPEWDTYDFEAADKLADYSEKSGMFLVGHTLIWHSQLAPFVQQIRSQDSMRLFLQEHITTIVQRYDGKVQGWDVVNEALEEDGSFRKSVFYEVLGEDYIVEAFRLAQAASPDTELYYNDYNIENPRKRAGAIRIVKMLQENGIRIDGVGIQGHWSLKNFPLEELEKSILEFSALGVKVMITELDLGVLPNPWDMTGADVNKNFEYDPTMNPYTAGLPQEVSNEFTEKYTALFHLLRKHKDKVHRVTFWGLSDANSWLNDWPVKNRTNYPLLFDRNYEPKPAYFSIGNDRAPYRKS